jgi:hypothetical protein
MRGGPRRSQNDPFADFALVEYSQKADKLLTQGDVCMNKLMLALTFALALAYGTAAQGQGLERVAARCDLPTGWSEVAKLEPRFVVFGELHGTNEGPRFVGALACALARRNKRVLVAIEHNASDNAALQAAWNSDEFEEKLASLGFAGRSDGIASMAMFDMALELHLLKESGLPVAIVAFNGFEDERQRYRFADLPGQGPHEAAQAENIANASMAQSYDYVLVLVGNLHARKTPISRNGNEFDPMARRLLQYGKVVSLNMRYAGGASWNCLLKPGADRTTKAIAQGDLDCGQHPSKGEPSLGPAMFIGLEEAKVDGRLTFDGFFWVGAISASPPKIP